MLKVVNHMGDWGMKLKGTGMQLKHQIINVALYKMFSFPCSTAVPGTQGQGVILKLAIDSCKMPGYEIWESFSRGENFPVSDCLETHSREGLTWLSLQLGIAVSRKQHRMHKP